MTGNYYSIDENKFVTVAGKNLENFHRKSGNRQIAINNQKVKKTSRENSYASNVINIAQKTAD